MTPRPSTGAMLLAILLLSACQWTTPASTAPPATVAGFPGNTAATGAPLLVDPAWLERRLNDTMVPPPLILDVSARRTYRQGHLPGAVHAYWQDTIDPYYPVYGVMLSDRNVAGARLDLLTRWGIGPDTDVVVYGDAANRYAAHVVWFLRYLGQTRTSLLDGGLAAWRGSGGEVSDDAATTPHTEAIMTPRPQPGSIIGTQELAERLDDPGVVIIDTRTPEQRRDTLNDSLPVGQIPGAVSLPWTDLTRDPYGRLRPPEDLRRLLAGIGVSPDEEIVLYGVFGVETGIAWLTLELLDYPSVRLYDQGWAHWASKPELPIG